MTERKKIAIFASGAGSNAANLIGYFKTNASAEVVLVVTNKANAGVIHVASEAGIPVLLVSKKDFQEPNNLLEELSAFQLSLIVLAGFLWKIPGWMIDEFPDRIINIHPALLPRHGGKGMYGRHVHEAVKQAGDTETGITVHYVNEKYDKGNSIFQARVEVKKEDGPAEIEKKVRALEMKYFPQVVEEVLSRM